MIGIPAGQSSGHRQCAEAGALRQARTPCAEGWGRPGRHGVHPGCATPLGRCCPARAAPDGRWEARGRQPRPRRTEPTREVSATRRSRFTTRMCMLAATGVSRSGSTRSKGPTATRPRPAQLPPCPAAHAVPAGGSRPARPRTAWSDWRFERIRPSMRTGHGRLQWWATACTGTGPAPQGTPNIATGRSPRPRVGRGSRRRWAFLMVPEAGPCLRRLACPWAWYPPSPGSQGEAAGRRFSTRLLQFCLPAPCKHRCRTDLRMKQITLTEPFCLRQGRRVCSRTQGR